MLPPNEGEDSWIDGLSVWKVVLIGYGCGLVFGFSIGYTVLNEFGNKWMASLSRNWNRKRRRSSAGNYYKSLYVSTISKRVENCALRSK
ncbi:hypothetical protein Gogos_005463 [Gossypium gossypioides]|uniref:Uncharacterized protein n=1 Tax=Gossypium gossypioides TaxID=34282 RepID=A0A7J9D5V3_GOSGO|nr:hypothetical protein [Gossypium gossypioides]